MCLQEQLSNMDWEMSLTEPLPLTTLQTLLDDMYRGERGHSLSEKVHKQVNIYAEDAGSDSSQKVQKSKGNELAEELLSFARSKQGQKKLRVVTQEVPKTVLPDGCTANLYDIKVDGGRGPDDNIYKKDEEIRKRIPRGTCLLEWKGKSNNNWISVVIYGHKKFTGGIGDEDEHQPENNDAWKSYFISDASTAANVVCMEKVNGEAAHIAGRYIDDAFYWIVGSKNVHIIIKEEKHIALYEGSRYEYAKIIAKTVCRTISALEKKRQLLLKALLHHTRCTLVAEIVQPGNQHIVNLSHLKGPELYFISMTSTYTGRDTEVSTFTVIPPHRFLQLCTALGLQTAAYVEVKEKDATTRKEEVRRARNVEGEVFYFLDKEENTIGLVKVKTVWYIILRALREKAVYAFTAAKKKGNWSLEERISSTHKRFREIQTWLKFSDDYLKKWESLAAHFLRWLHEEISKGKEEPGAIRPTFPVIWKKFLDDTKQNDHIELQLRCS